jgi:hypothetical protein
MDFAEHEIASAQQTYDHNGRSNKFFHFCILVLAKGRSFLSSAMTRLRPIPNSAASCRWVQFSTQRSFASLAKSICSFFQETETPTFEVIGPGSRRIAPPPPFLNLRIYESTRTMVGCSQKSFKNKQLEA